MCNSVECAFIVNSNLVVCIALTTMYNNCVTSMMTMYVQTYLVTQREVSWCVLFFVFFRGSCNWEPGRGVPGCRSGLRPGFCCCLVCCFEISSALVLTGCLTFSPAKWALPQLNGPVQVCNLSVNKTVD